MSQSTKTRNRKSVANLQQVKSEELPSAIAAGLMAYTNQTETPILSEYCAEVLLYEEFILSMAANSGEIELAVKILENKKRASLERKIYTQELNATIGANLLKSWREEITPEQAPKLRSATVLELHEVGASNEEIKIFFDIIRKLETREK